MTQPATIVMYHYVRDLAGSRFPEIKGLTLEQFQGQLDYMTQHYAMVKVDEFLAALEPDGPKLPTNAAILTFDDGYIDHYTNVFPMLKERGIQGFFFPPGKAVTEHQVLEVNKIHFVLASAHDKSSIVREIFEVMDEFRNEAGLKSNEEYYQTYAVASRFDTAEVVFIKRILQKGLPAGCRSEAAHRLFTRYVTEDEEAFAAELYMNIDQLNQMAQDDMYIGSHSYDHLWLDSQPQNVQASEVESSLRFLESIQRTSLDLGFNYPYGAYNDSLLGLLKARGCKFGVTTVQGIADLDSDDPLLLPRLDTNDLPKIRGESPNNWTRKVTRLLDRMD